MADFTSRIVEMAIGLAIALGVLTGAIVPAVVKAKNDPNLTDYALIIGLILLIFVFGLVLYVWHEMKPSGRK